MVDGRLRGCEKQMMCEEIGGLGYPEEKYRRILQLLLWKNGSAELFN